MFEFIGLVIIIGIVIYIVGVVLITLISPNEPFPWEADWDINESVNRTLFDDEYDKLVKMMNEPALVDLTSSDKYVYICMGSHDKVKIPVSYVKRNIEVFGLNVPIQEYYLDQWAEFKVGSQKFGNLTVTKKHMDKLQLMSSQMIAPDSLQQIFAQRVTLIVATGKRTATSSFRYTGKFTYSRIVRVTFKGSTRHRDNVESIVTVCSVNL